MSVSHSDPKFESQTQLRTIRMSYNEPVKKSYKGILVPLHSSKGATDTLSDLVGFIMSYCGMCVVS